MSPERAKALAEAKDQARLLAQSLFQQMGEAIKDPSQLHHRGFSQRQGEFPEQVVARYLIYMVDRANKEINAIYTKYERSHPDKEKT